MNWIEDYIVWSENRIGLRGGEEEGEIGGGGGEEEGWEKGEGGEIVKSLRHIV